MFALRKSTPKRSSRQQIAIQGVRDGILILPGNQYRMVLRVSSLNFELKSEEEQDVIIDTYESFLNAVGTPLQILVRTREIDIDKYLEELADRLSSEPEAIYRDQLTYYDAFIRSLITTNTILSRQFYVVVPYTASAKADFDLIAQQLRLTTDIVSKGLHRLGMQTTELSSLDVLDLFYSFYSPAQAKLQPLTEQALQLLHTTLIQTGDNHV